MGRVLFETDSLTVQQVVVTNLYDFAPLGQVFREIKAKLNTQFIRAEVVHVLRDCNKSAHVLAAMGAGLASGETQVWLDDFPADVTRLVTDNSGQSATHFVARVSLNQGEHIRDTRGCRPYQALQWRRPCIRRSVSL